MTEQQLEQWMLATDEERAEMMSSWNTDRDEGRNVAEACAALLVKECIYDITGITVDTRDGRWILHAFATDDYDSIKDRDIDFLGFELVVDRAAYV